jgi:hypothetical protein
MLDAVRAAVETTRRSLKTYEGRVANPLKVKTNTLWSYWNEEKDSFRAWLAEATWKPYIELKVKEQEEKALKEKEKAERENKKNLEHSIERCRNLIKYFEEVERALIDHGAKTWAELNPTAAAAQEALVKNTVPLQTLGTLPSSIIETPTLASESADFLAENYKTPSVPLRFYIFRSQWSIEPAPVHTLPLYEELFEACWKGNNERIKQLCLPKTGKRNKDTGCIQILCEVHFHSSIVSSPWLDDKVREEISTFKEYPSEVQNISSGTSIE